MEMNDTEHRDVRELFHERCLSKLSFDPTIFDIYGAPDTSWVVWAIDALKNNAQTINTPCIYDDGTFLQAKISSATGRAYPYYRPKYGMSAVIEAHQEITLDEFRVILANHCGVPFVFFHTGKLPAYKTGSEYDVRLAIVGKGCFFGYSTRKEMEDDGSTLHELHASANEFPYYPNMMFEVQESLRSSDAARIYRVKNPLGPGSLEMLSNTAEFTLEADALQIVGHDSIYLIGCIQGFENE